MLASPAIFVEEHLVGVTEERAIAVIKDCQKSIARWKRSIEEEQEKQTMYHEPSNSAKIMVYREYLVAARGFFRKMGWNYPLSKEEAGAIRFNERLEEIQKIEFDCGYARLMLGRGSETITFEDDKIQVVRIPLDFSNTQEELEQSGLQEETKSEFLELFRLLHIGEWKRMYRDPCVLDGIEWNLKIVYTDGEELEYSGQNRYVYNFDQLLDILDIKWLTDEKEDESES